MSEYIRTKNNPPFFNKAELRFGLYYIQIAPDQFSYAMHGPFDPLGMVHPIITKQNLVTLRPSFFGLLYY
jgi:hypothetical protein